MLHNTNYEYYAIISYRTFIIIIAFLKIVATTIIIIANLVNNNTNDINIKY